MKLPLLSKLRGLVQRLAMNMAHRQATPICPEYDMLVQSFIRWDREVRRTNLVVAAPPLLLGIDLHAFAERNHFPPAPELIQNLSNLPIMSVRSLSEEDSRCSICLERFRSAFEIAARRTPLGETDEKPIRLPCGHIFGNVCFQKWHYPFGTDVTCPVCRGENFEHHAQTTVPYGTDTVCHYEAWLDEMVWTDFVCGKRKSQEERARFRRDRYIIARERVRMANREWMAFDPGNRRQLKAWKNRRDHVDDMSWHLTAAEWEHEKDVALASRIVAEDWDLDADGDYIVHDYLGDFPRSDAAW